MRSPMRTQLLGSNGVAVFGVSQGPPGVGLGLWFDSGVP